MSTLHTMIAAAVASIDTADTTTRLVELQSDWERVTRGTDEARERLSAIATELAAETQGAEKVAAALIDGASASEAVTLGPNRARLEEERDALRGALRELRDQGERIQAEISEISNGMAQAIGEATDDIALALVETAKASAAELAETLASLIALGQATRGHVAEGMAAQRVLHGLMADGLLMQQAPLVPVPAEIREALAPIAALPGIRTTVPAHVVPIDPMPLIMAAGMLARG